MFKNLKIRIRSKLPQQNKEKMTDYGYTEKNNAKDKKNKKTAAASLKTCRRPTYLPDMSF